MRDIADILEDLNVEVKNDSYFQAETLEEFTTLINKHYSRISKLIHERNMAYAEIEAQKQGLKIECSL